jgi:predicted phage baseplate assembly protein
MSLRPPRLDDRSRQDLRDELVRRIPAHTPEWTDHNTADPGITLLELFADLGATLLERFNRVPEAARLAFLQLLGIEPMPARAATALVTLELPRNESTPVVVPWSPFEARLQVGAGPVGFEASEEITVLPVQLQAWIKQTLPVEDTETLDQAVVADLAALVQRNLKPEAKAAPAKGAPAGISTTAAAGIATASTVAAAGTTVSSAHAYYEPVSLPPVEEGQLPAPISTLQTVDGWFWLALLAPAPLLDPATREQDLTRLRRLVSERVLSLGVRVDAALCGPTDHQRCPDPGTAPPRWPLQWQISTGGFVGNDARVDRARYLPLEVVHDGTEAFGRSGSVRLRLPPTSADGRPGLGVWTADSFDPPDPDLLGVGELPPRLKERDAERVLAWIRVGRRDPVHPPLKVHWLAANALPVEQALSAAAPELLGYGDGRPFQELRLSQAPVLAGSTDIQVARAGDQAWLSWRSIEDLALAEPDDAVYRLEPESGTIRFGDGLHGRIPLPGEAIRCRSYRHGGGAAGNVGAGRIKRILGGTPEVLAANLKVSNPMAAEGGADAETVAQASARLPKVLRHNDRAVGRDDFTDLALQTPCAGIGRAHCLPRHLPHQRLDGVPGVVTLIVIPAYDTLHPDEPTPDRDQLRRVCEWLEPRRLVTTELYITPPTYVRLSVAVAVEAEAGVGEETLRRQVELALRQVLAPLPPFGPDGGGWPFGRDVGERDLEAAVLRVQGVRLVHGVLLSARAVDALGRADKLPALQRLPLEAWQLPSLREVRVEVIAADTDPETILQDPLPIPGEEQPAAGDDATSRGTIPVPVVREVC